MRLSSDNASQFLNPNCSSLPQGSILLLSLVAVTLYRLWLIPRLGVTLYIDEAQYWTWAQSFSWGYYTKPPVVAWLIAASTALFGNGMLAVKLPALILYPATAWLLFRLGTRLFNAQVGLWAGLTFAFMPLVSIFSLLIATDAPLLFFWAAAMLFLLRAIEQDRWCDWLLLGASLGLGSMSKYTMGAFAPSAFLYLLIDRKRRRTLWSLKLWGCVSLATLIFAPNVLWNWVHNFPTLRHTADITHLNGSVSSHNESNAGEFILAQIGSVGPGIGLAFLGGTWFAFKQWHVSEGQSRMQFLLCFSLPLLGLVFIEALRAGANGNWAAPALLPSVILAVAWLSRLRLRWWCIALGLNILIMFAGYHFVELYKLTGIALTSQTDPIKRAKGWDTLAQQTLPWLKKYPDALMLTENRTISAHMLYELRGQVKNYAEWVADKIPADHYQLTTPLSEQHLGRNAVLLTESDNYTHITKHFAQAQLLTTIVVEVEPGLTRQLHIVLLKDFKGYR